MNVVKRNGVSAPLDESKIIKCVEWACAGLSVSPSSIFDPVRKALYEGINTKDIHNLTIGEAAAQISVATQDANYVAAKLKLQDVYKQAANSIHYTHLRAYIVNAHRLNLLADDMLARFDLDALNAAIKPQRDFLFGYLGIQTLADRYFLRETPAGRIIELPQHFWMRVAMGLAIQENSPTERAIEFYGILSTLEFISSTPTLFNSGTRRPQLSSCYGNTVADTITNDEDDHRFASIFGVIEECAVLSKYAGGIGTDWTRVRGEGDHIKGTSGISSGIIPYLKVYNDTAVAVNQAGKRKGSFAPYLEPWHPDFESFIELKKNTGDERKRAHEIYPAAWTPDLFMKRVQARGVWSFFSPDKYPELHEFYGDEFEARYIELENAGKFVRQMPAIELWRKWLTMLFETGHPWITFKDESNRRNPQSHVGVVHNSNLCCMTGDQRVVTDRGMITVAELYASQIAPKVAGRGVISQGSSMLLPRPNAPIVKVLTKEGYDHKVTPDHRIWVSGKGWVEAQNLQIGDKLELQHVGMFGTLHKPQLALIAGLVAGDGNFMSGDDSLVVRLDLIDGKTAYLKDEILQSIHDVIADAKVEVSTNGNLTPQWNETRHGVRVNSVALGKAFAADGFVRGGKLMVPSFVWGGDEATVVEYIKGVFFTDGSVRSAAGRVGVSLSSNCKEFLQEMQILLANMGVKCSVFLASKALDRTFENGTYRCSEVFELKITSREGANKFEQKTGFITSRAQYNIGAKLALDLIKKPVRESYKQKMLATFVGLEVLPNEDAYCLTVDSEDHAWTVNGLITHNTEITLNNSDSESFVCNLGSVNLSRVDPYSQPDRFAHVVKTAMRMLDNVIDINFYPSDRAMLSNMRHRPVGLGVMGYMEWLVKSGIDFESDEHIMAADELFEELSYQVILASIDLAAERGCYQSYSGSKWSRGILPIDTARFSSRQKNWGHVREMLKHHGIRNSNCMAIAPTATISNIAGTTPCIEAAVDLVYSKTNMSGDFLIVDPTLKYGRPELAKTMFNIDPLWVVKAAAARQKWIDQAQSTNIFVKRGTKGKDLAAIYELAWALGLKTTYYLRSESQSVTEPAKEGEAKFCSISEPNCESCQ